MAFKKNLQGFLVDAENKQRQCTGCGKIYNWTSATVTLCNSCNTKRVKSTQSDTLKMLRRAKRRAILFNREFALSLEDIEVPEYCPAIGIPLKVVTGRSGGGQGSPSLDRIDNDRGYVKDNVQVISRLANQMKADASPEQLLKFADWIYRVYKNEPTNI